MTNFEHVDDFIDDPDSDSYASIFLLLKRMPAMFQAKINQYFEENHLFCKYKGTKWRVTGASRLGDVWITSDFNKSTGYDLRVNINECSDWFRVELK